ncbi:helix-turn-helix domain-containing protein [Pseudomonas putida]|uniref:helix-turn-helix domain-containing protein n=1 Tax=Pseudomonas putida TaxID=303 RepID=UPI003523118C
MLTGIKLRANPTSHQKLILSQWMGCARSIWNAKVEEGVVCGRGRNPTLRLWPTIFSGKIDVFPGDRRSRLISSMTSVAPA